ncbi:hypothetical protein RHMOL_Rhmol07G0242200 [Rhododendron molle]|uniref:Uncharacterized protein n=2 Tax=Rhododendron molle TaxID=49168 RepID=A0ACC0N3Z5_RHOML|nr:hypothetical protein RHMOL_Rhmol10G0194800 [Rhododendron molle]KAI8548047.1 hypothetical protein RHMOL_Rhmol07G0242200 [Rhododendron molle]
MNNSKANVAPKQDTQKNPTISYISLQISTFTVFGYQFRDLITKISKQIRDLITKISTQIQNLYKNT